MVVMPYSLAVSGAFSVLDDEPWIHSFIDLLGHIADQGFPTFASCFGFQGMILALGGEVIHDEPNAEVGSFVLETTQAAKNDPLFASLPATFVAQEGHKDRAQTLPAGVTNMARSERCPFPSHTCSGYSCLRHAVSSRTHLHREPQTLWAIL